MAGKATKQPSDGKKTAAAGRSKDGKFAPGNKIASGRNPLPPDIVRMCKELTPQAIQTAKRIMLDTGAKDADRLRAAEIIIDRGYGKARQAVDMDMSTAPRVVFVGIDEVKD